jgi:hypothetical protein
VDSSLTSIVKAFKKIAKGAAVVAHKLVLSQKRFAELEAANEAATRRKLHKRKRVQKEGILTVEDRVRLTTLKEFDARVVIGRRQRRGRALRWANRLKDAVDAAARLVITRAHASKKQR